FMLQSSMSSIEMLEILGVHTPLSYDYVLVAKTINNQERETFRKQTEFIEELKKKNFKVTKIIDDNLVFYGIQAPKEIFEKYRYLLKVSDACNWNPEYFCYHSLYLLICTENLRELIKMKVFETKFCLHEVKYFHASRHKCILFFFYLTVFYCVRNYFGEKVALYFLWLGWYTFLLVPPAIIGIIIFLYGISYYKHSPLLNEVCNSNTTMCPLCDKGCEAWQLNETCIYTKVTLLFDNEGTVFFAMFMAIWATLFLEFWKRHRATFVCEWKVSDWSEEEEELILELVNDVNCEPKKFKHSYWTSSLIFICILVIISLTSAVVVFRVIAADFLAKYKWKSLSNHSNIPVMVLGGFLHYFIITIMTRVNWIVARKLCDMEEIRSFASTEKSFTVKMFTFQFFTYFTSLFYAAFILGRINGRPGNYVKIAGRWRLEECHPTGCLTDLFIQMTIIMVLKQTISNVFEFTGPWLCRLWKRKRTQKLQRKCAHCYLKDDSDTKDGDELCENCKLRDWLSNYRLNDVDSFSLFREFLEMVIQFSFTTLFVAAFPLAPLLAFINNVIEIRLDAIKMVTLERRMVPKKTNNIGVWLDILEAIGVLAVIVNGLVIGVSSDFIPRLVYRYHYGPCAQGTAAPDTDCMAGYINNTLSVAPMKYMNDSYKYSENIPPGEEYKDYRSQDDYSHTHQFWIILASRFAFVILFEHVVVICKFIAAWFIPSAPMEVKNSRLSDKLKRLKEELQ
uniref:Anoctamin n=1 Tax=Oreochromis niloticus TaxID=8128 RepID=A0A669BTX4_ORENI